MKKMCYMLLTLIISFIVVGCNAVKSKSLDNNSHQQANTNSKFPTVTRTSETNVVCHNCRATFKLTQAMHKHGDIICPVCHQNYLKAKN